MEYLFRFSSMKRGLGAVVGDEHLAVLQGAHGAGVHVDIGVQLLAGHLEAAAFEQPPQAGRGDPLAQARDHAAGYKDIFRRHKSVPPFAPGRPGCTIKGKRCAVTPAHPLPRIIHPLLYTLNGKKAISNVKFDQRPQDDGGLQKSVLFDMIYKPFILLCLQWQISMKQLVFDFIMHYNKSSIVHENTCKKVHLINIANTTKREV